jgi:cell division septum initiation protein DivIVA
VALERQNIEKKDFPIGRRGYDPDAVDTHLSSLANEIEELKRTSRRRTETLASSASEQVRAIVDAAETSAKQIHTQAEDDAREVRSEANNEAQRTREEATAQAREYVGQVSEATSVMLQRIDAMEAELGALVESLRTGSNRLTADLQLLQGNLGELRAAAAPKQYFEPEPAAALPPSFGESDAGSGAVESLETTAAAVDELPAETIGPERALAETTNGATADGAAAESSDDTEGARLIALNMALNGTPREETDRYLADNFKLEDRAALLDDVYASVEG